MKILVAGSLAFDKILDFPGRFSEHILPERIHDLNVSFVTDNLSENFGGTAGNIAYNLALLGATPIVLSSAGNDFQTYQYWLESKGVNLSLTSISAERPTGFVTVMTDRSDNQIAAVFLGAMGLPCGVRDEEIPNDASFAIVSPGNPEDMRRFPALFRKRKIPFAYDPGQQIPALSADDLRHGLEGAEIFISNDYELSLAMDKMSWQEKDILEKVKMLVTTYGEKGSRILSKDGEIKIPCAKTGEVKDPTGAGDAYRAGLIFALLKKWPPETAGRFAAITSAYAVEGIGPQFHEFTLHSARARYAENFRKELPS